MSDITVSIVDGESVSVPAGTSVQDALTALLSNKQRKQTVAATIDGAVADYTTLLFMDTQLTPVKIGSDQALEVLRHSTAHIMALAVRDIFGTGVKVAIGPSIENGFYYDFLRDEPFTPEDFETIETRMMEIVREALPFRKTEMQSPDAIIKYTDEQEKFKVELIEDLGVDTVSFYHVGEFTDLCRGPHLPNTTFIRALKLLRVAGAYWRGDEKR
jgi:threonyl-tRNA synthetase